MSLQETQKKTERRGHRKTEAERGTMWPQAKECLESAEAVRGKKNSLPEPLEKVWSY